MVQGVNQIVNMNPNIAASSGNAMARLGQQLSQTGQDISGIMEATVRADEETKLMRMQQKWKEAHNKQIMFQSDNPNDPLAWQEHRAKMLPNIQAYNNEQKFHTKEGRVRSQLAYENWLSNTSMDVDRQSQKQIFINREKMTIVGLQEQYAAENPLGIQKMVEEADSYMSPELKAGWLKKADELSEQMIFDDSVDMVDADPKGSIQQINDGEGHFAHYKKDRDSREKLLAIARSKMGLAAREQGDALDAKIYSSPKFTTEDLKKMEENGELDQWTEGNLAKLRSGVERDEAGNKPITDKELVDAYNMIGKLEKRRSSMSEEDYIIEYNNVSASVMSVNGIKDVGWLKTYLDKANPLSKGEAGNAMDKAKTRGKTEATKSLVAQYNMGMFLESYVVGEEFTDKEQMGDEELAVQDQASKAMRDVQNDLHDLIDNYDGDPEKMTEYVRTQMGRLMGSERTKKANERVNKQYEKAKQIKSKNMYRTSGGTLGSNQIDNSTSKVSNKANFGGSSGWSGGKTKQEVERNLVEIKSPSGAPFKVNKTVAGNFESFLQELEDVVGYPINAKSSGGYNWRNKRGKSSLSQHSYGNAIDINWDENKAFWGGEDAISKIPNIGEIAARHGLVWGGSWKNKDTMQFEYHPSTGVPARGI